MTSQLIRLKMFRTTAIVSALMLATSMALAAKPTDPGGGGGGNKPPTGESGVNNLSFPLILSDGVGLTAMPTDRVWVFNSINNPATECIDEEGVTPGTPVDPKYFCYYGRKVDVIEETGEIVFSGDVMPWWLQKRPANFWKTLSPSHNLSTPLVVSAVDIGDLLESSPSIATRQIRVEFNLLQHVDPTDTELGGYVVSGWTSSIPSPCALPTANAPSVGCFAALAMSGAVPGTEQGINEIQGTDFGPGDGNYPGTVTLVDPATVRFTTPDVGGIQAIVYSRCARLVIQQIKGNPIWNPALGQWDGAEAPVVNLASYRGEFGNEITSSGSFVYGYNWNATTAAVGTYRLTFVLDGNDLQGPQCSTTLATKFESGGTQLVNVGENNQTATIVFADDAQLGDEGGLAYIDLTLTNKGGGKKGGK